MAVNANISAIGVTAALGERSPPLWVQLLVRGGGEEGRKGGRVHSVPQEAFPRETQKKLFPNVSFL